MSAAAVRLLDLSISVLHSVLFMLSFFLQQLFRLSQNNSFLCGCSIFTKQCVPNHTCGNQPVVMSQRVLDTSPRSVTTSLGFPNSTTVPRVLAVLQKAVNRGLSIPVSWSFGNNLPSQAVIVWHPAPSKVCFKTLLLRKYEKRRIRT